MKTTIKIDNVWSHIQAPSDTIRKQINKWEAKLSGPYGITHTDGRTLSGVLPLLFGNPLVNGITIDERKVPCVPAQIPSFVDRDYQLTAVQHALQHKRGILKLPTGSGKTNVIAGLAGALNCSHLIMVHKAHIAEYIAKTLAKLLNEEVGTIHGNANDYNKRVVCATFKSLYSREELLKFIQTRESILIDEVHTVPALTHFAVVLNTVNAYYRYGLSATPLIREDERDIHTIALLGPIIYEVRNQELYAKGFVVPPDVIWLSAVTKTDKPEYFEGYQEAIVNNLFRNQAIKQVLDVCEKPAIVFVKTHMHQQVLIDILRTVHGKQLVFVNQHDSIDQRQIIAQNMKLGATTVVVATSVFNEGVDVPNLRTVINATGASSWIAAIQEPGRGSRPFENKTSFKLYDFNDIGHKWFEDHTAERYAAYLEAGFTVDAPSGKAKVIDVRTEQYSMKTAKPKRGLWYRLCNDWMFLWLLAPVIIWLLWRELSR